MHLETLLPAIRSLHDLPRLVAALGHQPLWEKVPGRALARPSEPEPELTVVGCTVELPWFAIDSPRPEQEAARRAERISRKGRPCLVLALDREARRLAIAAGFKDCPSLELDLAKPSLNALLSVGRLAAASEGGSLAFAARAADALAAETLGRRFFREFRATLDDLSTGLPSSMQSEDRHDLALLQLTRILFLYFIQTKGWLGRERFLSEEVDSCLRRGRRIHRDLLRPLFFGTLNRPRAARSRTAMSFGPIPFLNGGLFEPHPLERLYPSDIPNHLWRDAFDRLFERFHFTVAEGERQGGVAPDMLGRVFEGVMAPETRRASGTFYTPAALVGEMLDAALTVVLAGRLGCREVEAERRLQDPDPTTSAVLATITLLDPAVGSGAFLLGALERLSALGIAPSSSARKRLVLQQNLFGVDLSAAAVRVTELRLWLAVIADDPADRPDGVEPLPNLDCLIRQGDSLFDLIGDAISLKSNPELVADLSALRRSVIAASGAEKRPLLRRLRSLEARALSQSLRGAEERAEGEIAECLQQARGSDLFGEKRGMNAELKRQLDHFRGRRRALRSARRKLSQEGEVLWFHYQSHFADVFARGGFDLVVGNPPWLRSEDIPRQTRQRLAGRYRWWRAAGYGYGNRPDLSVAFLERSLELARPGGVLAMLVPAKIARAGYGVTARHVLSGTTTLNAVVDLTGNGTVGFDATVYPMALIASKVAPAPQHLVRTALAPDAGHRIKQSGMAGGGPWLLIRDRLREVLSGLQGAHPKLGERFVCHLGLKTGANRIFLNPPPSIEPEALRWAVRGRDVTAFHCVPHTRLLWTHDSSGQARRQLPPQCAAYLEPHEAELRRRRDYSGGPPWTVFRVRAAIAPHRVVWADLARQLAAAALTTPADLHDIPLNSCYVVVARNAAEAEWLSASLNSTWLRAAARLGAVPAAGGFARFNAATVALLPLPSSLSEDPDLPRLARLGRAGGDVQEELDEVMAQHLGLSNGGRNALRSVVDSTARHRR